MTQAINGSSSALIAELMNADGAYSHEETLVIVVVVFLLLLLPRQTLLLHEKAVVP